MSIQFNHQRSYDGYGNLQSMGGATHAVDTTDLDLIDFKVGKELILRTAIAKCSPKDRFIRKQGASICLERLRETTLSYVSLNVHKVSKSQLGSNAKNVGKVITTIQLESSKVTYIFRKYEDANFHLVHAYLNE